MVNNFIYLILLLFFVCSTKQSELISEGNYDINQFNWVSYLEIYQEQTKDLQEKNQANSYNHFLLATKDNTLLFPRWTPNEPSYSSGLCKLEKYISYHNKQNLNSSSFSSKITSDIRNNSFVIYHVGFGSLIDGFSDDILINNLIIFLSAIGKDAGYDSHSFYWINILGLKFNHYTPLIEDRVGGEGFENVALLDWSASRSDVYLHYRTLALLEERLIDNFDMIVMLNEGTRGPLIKRENGDWLEDYRDLLKRNNVGIVGSSFVCSEPAHVQTHAFAIRSELIPLISEAYPGDVYIEQVDWMDHIQYYEVRLSQLIKQKGYNLSSLGYKQNGYGDYFNGTCMITKKEYSGFSSLSYIPYLFHPNILFIKWGGSFLRSKLVTIASYREAMMPILSQLIRDIQDPKMIYPESSELLDPSIWAIRREYLQENHLLLGKPTNQFNLAPKDTICFAISISSNLIIDYHRDRLDLYDQIKIDNLFDIHYLRRELLYHLNNSIYSLQRQTNSLWKAFLYINFDSSELFHDYVEKEKEQYKSLHEFSKIHSDYEIGTYVMNDDIDCLDYSNNDEYPLGNDSLELEISPLASIIKDLNNLFNISRTIIDSFQDNRLQLISLPPLMTRLKDLEMYSIREIIKEIHENQYTELMKAMKANNEETGLCKWINLGRGDSIYGSKIVEELSKKIHNLAASSKYKFQGEDNFSGDRNGTEEDNIEDFSEEFAEEDIKLYYFPISTKESFYNEAQMRNLLQDKDLFISRDLSEVRYFLVSSIRLLYDINNEGELSVGGGVNIKEKKIDMDWSGVFLHRDILLEESFDRLTLPSRLIKQSDRRELERRIYSEYFDVSLEMDVVQEIDKIIYDGSSPLWCMASGRMWLDHQDYRRYAKCIILEESKPLCDYFKMRKDTEEVFEDIYSIKLFYLYPFVYYNR